jgi:Holliday junction resolvase
VKSGVPDYIIYHKNKLLFIEMKRVKGGKVSPEQEEWIFKLNTVDGVEAVVCYGFDQAKIIIDELCQ